jgi:hypothetical protein
MGEAYEALYAALAPAGRPADARPFPVDPDPVEMAGWMGSFVSPLRF